MLTPQDKGRKFDKTIAKKLNYKAVSGSGNGVRKGDGRSNNSSGKFLLENKFHNGKYLFTIKEWEKHELQAMHVKLEPVFVIGFPQTDTEVVVLAKELWRDLCSFANRAFAYTFISTGKGTKSVNLMESVMKQIRFNSDHSVASELGIGAYEFVIITLQEFQLLKDKYESM